MKRTGIISALAFASGLFLSLAQAAPGTWWDVTSKMEMDGMPFAMPPQTMEVCIPKGQEKDPRYTQGKEGNCKMTDVKQSGNKVTYKGTCVENGETMTMLGETIHDGKSFKSTVRMTGKSRGEPVDMKMESNGRNKGESCDTAQKDRKMQAMLDKADANQKEMCDKASSEGTPSWIMNGMSFIGPHAICKGQQAALCAAVKRDLPQDEKVYNALKSQSDTSKQLGAVSVAKTCNVDMAAAPKLYCKAKAETGPLKYLQKYCPSEAKAYREKLRKECASRGYTSQRMVDQCAGEQTVSSDDESAGEENSTVAAKSAARKSAKPVAEAAKDEAESAASDEAIKQGTKALKGLFGF